jgi:acetylornithine deacetylase/succinyl-diaminopimelate desuccinylase-like protein
MRTGLRASAGLLIALATLIATASTGSAQGTPTAPARAASSSTLALARELLAGIVAINTTHSEGATTPAAELLAARFRAAGFPAADVMVIGPNAKQRNLVVRFRGRDRSRKPVVFNSHLDVVEAPRLEWSTNPFRLTEKDGYLYGRGVLDDKGPAATMAAAWISAKRRGVVPERDLVLALTAGEETGEGNGVEWLLAKQRALVDAAFVINLDAGGGEIADGAVRAFSMEAAEKVYLDIELVARGPGGHSSVPGGETPIDVLARALGRLGRYQFPVKVNAVVRAFMEQRSKLTTGETSQAMAALARDPDDLAAQSTLARDRALNALLRTTCIATMLRGGTAPNAIPQEVGATVNCRILPGEPPDGTIATIKREIADTSISVRILSPAMPSPPSTPTAEILAIVVRALAGVALDVPIIPYMESGATDAIYFRNVGIPVYGIAGTFVAEEDIDRLHGRDERLSLSAFEMMVRYHESLLAAVAGFAASPTSGVRP